MQKIYSPEELNSFSRETLVAVILSMQNQLTQLNTNMERLIEQIASADNHRYGRSSEKLDVIAGQLELELIFNEAEALTETLYVVEPREEDVIQVTRRKKKGKREADLKVSCGSDPSYHSRSKAAGNFWLRWMEAAPG